MWSELINVNWNWCLNAAEPQSQKPQTWAPWGLRQVICMNETSGQWWVGGGKRAALSKGTELQDPWSQKCLLLGEARNLGFFCEISGFQNVCN